MLVIAIEFRVTLMTGPSGLAKAARAAGKDEKKDLILVRGHVAVKSTRSLPFYRLIETDAKSLNSLSCQSGHSRRSSETSQISITSGSMSYQENAEEDLWGLWGKIINEWETWSKRKQPQLKVLLLLASSKSFSSASFLLINV